MPALQVVTVNILSDLSLWHKRKSLLVDQLCRERPDLIALQEVALPDNPANWLAEQLSQCISAGEPYQVYLCPKSGEAGKDEALAILSRLKVVSHEVIDLQSQGRVAQRVLALIDDSQVSFANVHLFWQPGESAGRERQVERLIGWMNDGIQRVPTVICGDFNGTPDTRAIKMLRQHYCSAFAVVHGREPSYTCPTPLVRSRRGQLRSIWSFISLIRPKDFRLNWKGTLDYIFTNQQINVLDCRLVFDQPAAERMDIYPSDHFGLSARLELKNHE